MTLDPPQSSGEALQNSSSQNLIREVKNWRDWTYTDGSLQKNVVGQGTGSGVYHLNVFQYVNLKGVGITNTISHAELAAAVIHGYSHTATDSLTSLHQFKKQLSHSNLHRHHIQGDVLQSIAKAIFFFWWGFWWGHGPQQGPDRMKEKTYKTGKRKTPA